MATHKLIRNLEEDFDSSARSDSDVCQGDEFLTVFLRIRPFLTSEKKQNCQSCVEVESSRRVVLQAPKDSVTYKNSQRGATHVCHEFTFTHVFDHDTDQQSMFNNSMLDIMRNFLHGQNCLVFAYGATNAGKTHTIQGFQDDPGILPRALDVLFNSIQDCVSERVELMPVQYDTVRVLSAEESRREEILKENVIHNGLDWEGEATTYLSCDSSVSRSTTSLFSDDSLNAAKTKCSRENLTLIKENIQRMFASVEHRVRDETTLSVDHSVRYTIWVSFCEIYNENIHDLLDWENQNVKRRPILKLAADIRGNMYVKGCRQFLVTSADEAIKLILIGQKNLRVASTKLNQKSSRSHSIFSVKLITSCTDGKSHKACVQHLSFCDLAGSERYAKTQSHGDRLTEAKNINTSLLVLGRCIHMLRENQCNKDNMKLIPFRESKLTHLLQNFFIKTGKVSMIVNISQDDKVFDENLHVLKYSAVARQVRIVPDIETTRSHRGTKVSLILAQGFGSRSSVAWSTTLSDATDLKSLADTVAEVSEENEVDVVGDLTLSEMCSQIETLQQELAKEKKEKQMLETEIRAEVASEVQVCIEEMENYYKERMKEIENEAEELAEQRMASYMRALNRHKASATETTNKDEDEISKEYEIQVKEQEYEISNLQAELQKLQSLLAKETTDNSAFQGLLTELGCYGILEVKQLLQKQKASLEEFQSLSRNNEDAAIAHNSEKEILEEQLQCLREKFASEVNKNLMLQHEVTKQENKFAHYEELVAFLSEVGCADVALVREQWSKYKQLQEEKALQDTQTSPLPEPVRNLLQELECENIWEVKEEWDKKERLISSYTMYNEKCANTIKDNDKRIAELEALLTETKNEVAALTHAKDDFEQNLIVQLTNTQNLLDDLGMSSLDLLREEWILHLTVQEESAECNRALREQVSVLQQEVAMLQQKNQNGKDKEISNDQNIHGHILEKSSFEELSCDESICSLQATNSILETKVLESQETITALQINKTELENQILSYEETIRRLQATQNMPETKILQEQSMSKHKAVNSEHSNDLLAEETITKLQTHNKSLEDKILFQEDRVESLQASKSYLEEVLSLNEERHTILAEKDLLCHQLESARKKNQYLEQEMDLVKCSLAEHAMKLDVTDDLKALEVAKQTLEIAKSSLEQELIALKQKSVELAQSFECEVSSLKAVNERLINENHTLQQKKCDSDTRLCMLENELTTKISAIQQKDRQLYQMEEDLKETNKVLELKNTSMHERMQKIKELEQLVTKFRDDFKSVQAEKEELIKQLECKFKNCSDLENSVEKLTTTLETVQNKSVRLHEELKQKTSELRATEKCIEALKGNLESVQSQNVELVERLKNQLQELSEIKMLEEKIKIQLANAQAEKLKLTEQLDCKSKELTAQVSEISFLKEDLQESRRMEEDSACKHIRYKNKLQEILTLFDARTLDDVKAKMNEYDPLRSKIELLNEEITALKDNWSRACAQIKEQSGKILALAAEDQEKEMVYNERISNATHELRSLQEILIEEIGSLSLTNLRKQISNFHRAEEQVNLLQAEKKELALSFTNLQKTASECQSQLQSKIQALELKLSALQEKMCDCGDFKEPVVFTKKTRSRKTRTKADVSEINQSGVTTRSSRRRNVLEESNSQETTCLSDSTSDGSATSSLRSRKLYKENVSLLESSPQKLDSSKQDSARSAVMKKL